MRRAAAGSEQGAEAEITATSQVGIRRICLALARDLRTALDRDLAPFGLRAQQAAMLLRCCRRPGSNPSHLAAAVGTDTAGATGLIDQLAGRGLVVRRPDPADRRAVLVEPTAAGRSLVPRLREVFQAVNEQMLDGFSERETATLEALLLRLRQNVQERLAETADIELPSRRPRRRLPRAARDGSGGLPH